MTQTHVYAAIDSATLSDSVADYASWIANTVNTPLTFLHNVEHHSLPATNDLSGSIGLGSRESLLEELIDIEQRRSKILIQQGCELLAAAVDRASTNKVENCSQTQRHGSLAETLLDLEDHIRVLVLGLKKNSNDAEETTAVRHIESIIRALHKPVLVVNKAFSQPKKLLLAYDGSDAANKALNWLITSPLYKNIVCHLIHVCNHSGQNKDVLDSAARQLENVGITVQSQQLSGDVATELLHYQQQHDIDLIVMGSFGHSRLREMFLGSFTLTMLLKANIPLLLLR